MEFMASLFSFMFLLAFFIYLYWGIYIIRINPKDRVNKAFLSLSIALCIWSFGYAMGNSALNAETALFWRRVASVGRIYLFSIVLHFMLLLTHEKDKLKKKWPLLLLHIPAALLVYVFSISNTLAPLQYNLIQIDYGWVNKPAGNIWTNLYYSYGLLYMLTTLGVVMRWKRNIDDKKIIKQANLIFTTIAIAVLFGAILDILPSKILVKPFPQLSSIFILLPVGAMYHAARYFDVFKIETVKKEETIITSQEQKKIFTNLSIGLILSGFLAFVSEYFSLTLEGNRSLNDSLIMGGPLVITGLILATIQQIKKEKTRENATVVVLLTSVPLVALLFSKYSGVTAWVLPIIIILSSLLFNKRILLISTTLVAIATQRLIWIISPDAYVLVNEFDYIARMVIIFAAFFIGSYINRIYIAKIKDNKYQIEFQKMVSDISLDFVCVNQENFNDKVNHLLGEVGRFFHVDRTYLFTINHSNQTMTYSNEWCKNGINEEVGTIEEMPLDVFPWWIEQLNTKGLVYIEDVDEMPTGASAEQDQLHRQGVKSLISVPIRGEDKLQAFIGMDSVERTKKWSEEDIDLLNIIGNILSSGLVQIKADKEIEFMAYYDNLTKLPNRFLFEDRVNQAINLSKRTASFISIIFIDLDSFKSVNDTIGHKGGDLLLEEVSKSLVGVLRKTDTVARFGGDEFMIMLNNILDHKMVTKIADKIMKIFSETFLINGQEFLITASAGIATSPVDGENAETLIKNADIAMYRAKAKGKNQYAMCTKIMKEEVQTSMELSNDLYRALDNNELIVYYQPQIDLVTKKITGVEALLRWMHPVKGMISPGVFIPIAEKNSLINSIGEWVLREACIQNKKWQDKGLPHMNIAVNLSAIQIINPKLPASLESVIKETGLDPKYIELEITESIAIKETNYVIEVLNNLKKIGVSIAIDDFGTEYSSLSRLKLLPIDRIKIDMQFVQGLETNEKDKAITMVIINLAKSLGLNVLAEGVETENQLEFLNQKMCDNVQGFYYYKPMPADEMEKILVDLDKIEAENAVKLLELNPIIQA